MHTYAKYDQNRPCGSRVLSILLTANVGRTDRQTHTVIMLHTFILSVDQAQILMCVLVKYSFDVRLSLILTETNPTTH